MAQICRCRAPPGACNQTGASPSSRPAPTLAHSRYRKRGRLLFFCKHLGHRVMGLDLDWPPMYAEMFELMQVPRRVWRIEPFQALPDLGTRFELLTGFAVCFNSHGSEQVWGLKEREFFLDDVRKNLLTRMGEIYFELNPESWGYYTSELGEFFRSRGAVVEGKKIWFKPPADQAVRLKRRQLG